jgi:hypothetical protein
MLAFYDQNKQEVLKSPIVAKAVIKRNDHFEIIVVFEKSTRHEFYWIFRVKSPRSARRSWKFSNYYARDFNSSASAPYSDFGSFVGYYASRNAGQVISERMHYARRLAMLLVRTGNETIHADWTPRAEVTGKLLEQTERMNHKKLEYLMR